jgi:hypothetical protein
MEFDQIARDPIRRSMVDTLPKVVEAAPLKAALRLAGSVEDFLLRWERRNMIFV